MAFQQASTKFKDVDVAFHLGAPATSSASLVWSLRKDEERIEQAGSFARPAKAYQDSLREILARRIEGKVSPLDRDTFFEDLADEKATKRLLLSDTGALGNVAWILGSNRLFQNAARNTEEISDLFFPNRCTFFLSTRNPATHLPAIYDGLKNTSWADFVKDTELSNLRWSEVVEDIQSANPDCKIVVWRDEDAPVIWPRILERFSGVTLTPPFTGNRDAIDELLTPEGMSRLDDYLAKNASVTGAALEKIYAAFLKHFPLNDPYSRALDIPGWSHMTIDGLTHQYNDDIMKIATMPGVSYLAPAPSKTPTTA